MLCVRAGKTLAIRNGIWLEAIALTRQSKNQWRVAEKSELNDSTKCSRGFILTRM